jgi:hypothetical protein
MNFMFYISLFACFSYLLMGTSTLIINWKADFMAGYIPAACGAPRLSYLLRSSSV